MTVRLVKRIMSLPALSAHRRRPYGDTIADYITLEALPKQLRASPYRDKTTKSVEAG